MKQTTLALIFVSALTATGCASFQPLPIEQVPFIERAQTQKTNDISVTVAVPTEEEARRLFDAKLDKKRIQPVWIEIVNDTDDMDLGQKDQQANRPVFLRPADSLRRTAAGEHIRLRLRQPRSRMEVRPPGDLAGRRTARVRVLRKGPRVQGGL
jgi:hypothetical protein